MTTNQKKILIKYIGVSQLSSFALSLKQNLLHIFCLLELLLHNLFFRQYLVEYRKLSIYILPDCRIVGNVKKKIKWLGKLKCFRTRKILSFKRIFTRSTNRTPQLCRIYFVANLLIQQLFILVLNPRVRAKTELNRHNLKKIKVSMKGLNKIRSSLCYKLWMNCEVLGYTFWGMCFNRVDYSLLLKNIFVPLKYEYIFKNGLYVEFAKYSIISEHKTNPTLFTVKIFEFLWINLIFDKLHRLIDDNLIKPKVVMRENFDVELSHIDKLLGNVFEDQCIRWDFFWGIKGFGVLSNSRKLLSFFSRKVPCFLLIQNLYRSVCKVIWVRANADFRFFNATFFFDTKLKTIRNRVLCSEKNTQKRQFHHKSFINIFSINTDTVKFFINLHDVTSLNYSVYKLISILNGILKKWMRHFIVNFSEVLGLIQSRLYGWFRFWVERKYGKNSRIFLSEYSLCLKFCCFHNHLEMLHHLTKTGYLFLNFFFWRFIGIRKRHPKFFYFLAVKTASILGLFSL